MSNVTYKEGNITDDNADILVATVNTVGVMGKGVALAFKTKYPSILPPYKKACNDGIIVAGKCHLFSLPDPLRVRYWVAFATKDHWRYPSRYEWIESGLHDLERLANTIFARSIAIPRIGCGNGGLDWKMVEPTVLHQLSKFDLRIYL